jgi:hypothetical protein
VDPQDDLVPSLKYEERVVAYVDVLGWRKLIQRSVTDPLVRATISKAVHSLKHTQAALAKLKVNAIQGGQEDLYPEVTVFSDTIVASCRPNPVAIEVLVMQMQMYCIRLMVAGLYTRGAITRGHLYHDDGVIIGPALVEAYTLESTLAKYPRIIVADVLRPISGGPSLNEEAVIDDYDGLGILHLFKGGLIPIERDFVGAVRERVELDLEVQFEDIEVRAKPGWLLSYLKRLEAQGGEPPPAKP